MQIDESGVSAVEDAAGEKSLLARPKQNLAQNGGGLSS
jgi:hypothetical protein